MLSWEDITHVIQWHSWCHIYWM